jgi:hypothetical protein
MFRIRLTDDFGKTCLMARTYTGDTARADARAMARNIRDEMNRFAYIDRGTDRRVANVQVVPA